MVQVQVDLSDEENKIVGICRVEKDFESKEETIKYIVRKFKKRGGK